MNELLFFAILIVCKLIAFCVLIKPLFNDVHSSNQPPRRQGGGGDSPLPSYTPPSDGNIIVHPTQPKPVVTVGK